jgi:hypothetical protein
MPWAAIRLPCEHHLIAPSSKKHTTTPPHNTARRSIIEEKSNKEQPANYAFLSPPTSKPKHQNKIQGGVK